MFMNLEESVQVVLKLSISTVWPQNLLSYVCSHCLWFEL